MWTWPKKWSHAWLWIPWHFLEGNKNINYTRWWQLKYLFIFIPTILGKFAPIWRAYFSDGLVQPPTSYTTNNYGTLLLDWNMFPKSTSVSEVLGRTNKNIMPSKIDLLAQKEWYCTAYNWLKIAKAQYFILQHSIGGEVSFWFFGINFTRWFPTNIFSDWPFP